MWSSLFVLFAVCCVAVSSDYVMVHVKDLVAGYNVLEFKGAGSANKKFLLDPTTTDGSHVKVTGTKIDEEALDVGFVPTSASILGVTKPKITIKKDSDCKSPKTCIKQIDETINYMLHVSGVVAPYTTLVCKGTDGAPITKPLVFSGSATGSIIVGANGVINLPSINLGDAAITECAIAEAALLDTITIPNVKGCDSTKPDCFENAAPLENSFKLGLLAICLILGKML